MRERIHNRTSWQKAALLLSLTATLIISAMIWLLLYQYDNKYTSPGPRASRGTLTLSENALDEYSVLYLVDGWAYYGGRLLTPQDFATAPLPDQYVFIGQYGGFAAGSPDAPPYGSASYHLRIDLPNEKRSYTLELPEIFSAYRLYINGELVIQMGEPISASYRPQTGNKSVTFEAGGSVELLFAVSDYSHFYSGMVYPPAFGEPDAVSKLLYTRFLIRGIACAVALTIGLLAALIGFLNRKQGRALLFAALCACYVGYTAYPIAMTLWGGSPFSYGVERFAFCGMLALVMLLGRSQCGIKSRWGLTFPAFGAASCLISLAVPLLSGNLPLMMAYSALMVTYEWIAAAFLSFAAARAVWQGKTSGAYAMPLLIGILAFDTALVMDRLLTLYEPIVTGWFIEIASFVLVLCMGVAIGREVAEQYRGRAVMRERALSMERLYQTQQAYYTSLRAEMEETRRMRHDMRHHFTAIDGMLKGRQYDELGAYLMQYAAALPTPDAMEYCPIGVINVLAYHYDSLCKQNGISFDLRSEAETNGETTGISDADLCCIFSNLMENAVEACLRVKVGTHFIRVGIALVAGALTIHVKNSTDGCVKADGDTFLSSKGAERKGYGLASIRAIVEKYGGSARFAWDKALQTFTSVIVIIVE